MGEGGAGTSSPRSAKRSSLLTSEEIFPGTSGRTFAIVAHANVRARGFWFAAQPERIETTMQRIEQTTSCGERKDVSMEQSISSREYARSRETRDAIWAAHATVYCGATRRVSML